MANLLNQSSTAGTDGDDFITGTEGNDTLAGGLGDDTIDGGFGYDVARFSGLLSTFRVERQADGSWLVTDLEANDGDEGSDSLLNIELVQFADGQIDLSVNDAAVLTQATPTFSSITEDDENNAGQTVASILGSSVTDADANALQGIALYGVTGSNGFWEHSNDGISWITVWSVSEDLALLLRSTDYIRWRPDGTNGTTATLSYYAWDQSSGTAGAQVSVASRGETTAFSNVGDVASLEVTSVNDAPRFNKVNGFVTTDLADNSSDRSKSVTVQPDGKIVMAGFYRNASGYDDFALVRYNTDGSLDTGFGVGGIVTTGIGSTSSDYGQSVTVQSDGKIVVTGYSNASGNTDFALVRYNTDGSLDPSFGSGGIVTTGGYGIGRSVTIQSDGKILVTGWSSVNHAEFDRYTADFVLFRYDSNGVLDETFGDGGKVAADMGGPSEEDSHSVTVQPDGKIVVAGMSYRSPDGDFALVRYNADGTLDTSFGKAVVSYTENTAPIVLDGDIAISDFDFRGGDTFDEGATLTLARVGGANAQDLFSGAGIGAGVASGDVTVDSTVVGTYSYAGGSLVISFNSNATQAHVTQTARSLAYRNSSDAPDSSVEISWTFNDGNSSAQGSAGALSTTTSTTVSITNVNDAPTGAVSISVNNGHSTETLAQGDVLTASNNLADADGLGTISYQWQADGLPIGFGVFGESYTLTQAEVGKAITVTASYTDGFGVAESVTS